MIVFTGKKDGGFDRAQWKNIQMTMNDSQKFVDMLHNVPWEDGLMDDVLRGRYYKTCITKCQRDSNPENIQLVV